jgi:hypothetical protein
MPSGDLRGHGANIRQAARLGRFQGQTSGAAPGLVQANIVILPHAQADQFAEYCAQNAKACPVLAMSQQGDPSLPTLGADIDIRYDLPRYRLYRHGEPVSDVTDIADLWRDDLVTFAIGCSFTFEHALIESGLTLRHVQMGCNVAMYRTSIATKAVGPFGGPLVVSMRPFKQADVARATAISARFPLMHGGPVHQGDPAQIGIKDVMRPDYGDPVPVSDDETPLFWACGVTSQAALQHARLPFFMAHAPGFMLVTDLPHRAFDREVAVG